MTLPTPTRTAVIIQDGLRRMYQDQQSVFYYLTLYNENYPMPEMPQGCEKGILKGMYRVSSIEQGKAADRPQLFGSGPILREALRAQQILHERFKIASDVWSVTSYRSSVARRSTPSVGTCCIPIIRRALATSKIS